MSKEKCGSESHCCEGCHHHHREKENKTIEKALYGISILLFLLGLIPALSPYKVVFYLACIVLAGHELILNGIKDMLHLNFEEDTLMTIAVIAAFVLGEFPESCMVVLLFKLGEFLEEKAVEKSNQNIKEIVEIKAKTANLLQGEKVNIVKVETLKVGDTILIKPGEMIPVDSSIIKGASTVNTANITGESRETLVKEGDHILSGTLNLTGALTCLVEKDEKNSTASQIVDLVYQATNNKGKTEKLMTKFSKIYTPIVLCIAIIVAIVPPIIGQGDWKEWILRALVFLVASCPCSIVISVPLAFFSCIGAISKKGMLIKGTKHIEALAKAKQIAFDKTGTITTGKMEIEQIMTLGSLEEEEILTYAYALERNSNHPISTAIAKEVENRQIISQKQVEKQEEIAGYGMKGIVEGKQVLLGNEKLVKKENIEMPKELEKASYLVIDGKIEASIILKEEIREDSKEAIKELRKQQIEDIILLTGDNQKNAERIANQVEIKEYEASLLPQDKLEKVKIKKEKGEIIFVGDGINDSPVLAESSFGISMGEGAEIASSTADAILISNHLSTIPKAIKIARKTIFIIWSNILFSLLLKAIVLTLGVLGIAPIWLAIVADTGVSLLTVLNSVRIFK